jgi:hypothetical protein
MSEGRAMKAETIAKALGGRKAGAAWIARCPAHNDRDPSLSIQDANDCKVLVRCHVGCGQAQVIAKLRSLGCGRITATANATSYASNRAYLRTINQIATTPNAPRPRSPSGRPRRRQVTRWLRAICSRAACVFHRHRRSASMLG